MQHGMQMIELAQSIERQRKTERGRYPTIARSSHRAEEGFVLRQRIGHRLIVIGERMVSGRSQVVTR